MWSTNSAISHPLFSARRVFKAMVLLVVLHIKNGSASTHDMTITSGVYSLGGGFFVCLELVAHSFVAYRNEEAMLRQYQSVLDFFCKVLSSARLA